MPQPHPLCPKCSAPAGDATTSPKMLFVGIGWVIGSIAVASHFWLSQPKWAERAVVGAALGIVPLGVYMWRARRRTTHWRCMRCKHEWPRR